MESATTITSPSTTLTLYSIITPFDAFEISRFFNKMENGAYAPFSITFSNVFITPLKVFLNFFNVVK